MVSHHLHEGPDIEFCDSCLASAMLIRNITKSIIERNRTTKQPDFLCNVQILKSLKHRSMFQYCISSNPLSSDQEAGTCDMSPSNYRSSICNRSQLLAPSKLQNCCTSNFTKSNAHHKNKNSVTIEQGNCWKIKSNIAGFQNVLFNAILQVSLSPLQLRCQ